MNGVRAAVLLAAVVVAAADAAATDGPLLAPDAPGAAAVIVADSLGQIVGPVIAVDVRGVVTTLRLAGRAMLFRVGRGALEGSDPLYFESRNCTGTPYLAGAGHDLFEATGVYGTAVYVVQRPRTWRSILARSSASSAGCVSWPDTAEVYAWPARLLGGLGVRFVPPFRVR